MGVTLFYNSECADCVRRARRTARLDWLRRVQISTDDSPIGTVSPGEIVVVDGSDRVLTGIHATRAVCMQVPAYLPYGLALQIPLVRWIASRSKRLCDGDACTTDNRQPTQIWSRLFFANVRSRAKGECSIRDVIRSARMGPPPGST